MERSTFGISAKDAIPSGEIADEREYEAFPDVAARNRAQCLLEIPAMLRMLGIRSGLRVLEIGCGRGVALGEFSRRLRPESLVGIDVDPALAQVARARLIGIPRVRIDVGDARALPYPAGYFDLIFDFGTCYHIARHERALREVSRVLRPGGLFAHETALSQLFSHPRRRRTASLGWDAVPELRLHRWAGLWASRRKTA